MKRFLIDGLLVLILVAIGNTFVQEERDPLNLDEKIAQFERQIQQQELMKPQIDAQAVQSLDLNQASKAALASSEFIETVVGTSVGIVASIFKAIVE